MARMSIDATEVVENYDAWLRLGWTDVEIQAVLRVDVEAGPAYVAARGRKREQAALRVVNQILGDAGLTDDDYGAWVRGGEPPRLGFDVALPEGRTLVKLPAGYNDLTDRPQLVGRLHDRIGADAQVETIVTCRDGSRSAAVVVRGEPSWRPLARTLAIPDDRRESSAGQIDADLRRDGETLLGWDYDARRQLVGRLAPSDLVLRARIASVLKRQPWEVRLSTTWGVDEDGDGELDSVTLRGAPDLSPDPERARTAWLQIARTVVGHDGWTVEIDAHAALVTMRAGVASALPSRAPFQWPLIDGGTWDAFPVATDGYGRPVYHSLLAAPHGLVAGKTGSGKTILLQAYATTALIHGFDLAIIDPIKSGLDFLAFQPWVGKGMWGCGTVDSAVPENISEALAVLRALYEEGMRRKRILLQYGVPKCSDLTPEQQIEHGIRPIMALIDEFTSLAAPETVPASLPRDDPERVELEDVNADKARLVMLINKLVMQLRFVWVHVIVGTQRFDTALIGVGAGGLRAQLGARLLLGRTNGAGLTMTFEEPSESTEAYAEAHGAGAPDRDPEKIEKRPGRGVAELDGVGHKAIQTWYAPQSELVAALIERQIPRTVGDIRPVRAPEGGYAKDPMSDWDPPEAPEIKTIATLEMTLDDLVDANDTAPGAVHDDGWGD